MDILILITLILLSASGIFSQWRQLQMLQQNSYFPSRYFSWFKSSYTVELALCAILYCAVSTLYLNGKLLAILIISAALLIMRVIITVRLHKKSIKKLVFTGRIKRLLACEFIILALLISLYGFFPQALSGEIGLLITVMLSLVSPILTLLAWLLTLPIEKLFAAYYINDAKRILKNHRELTVIGITGSYGKTTTKFILNRILSEKFNTVCTPQSFNTPMGVVRTVRTMLKPQTQIFICEMGAKKRGDIKEICDIANPSYAIITSVGKQHLDTFKTEENIYKTKFELADHIKMHGIGCLANADSEGIKSRLDGRDDVVYFGENTEYFVKDICYNKSGSSFTLCLDGNEIPVKTRLLGLHSISDILAACALAHILGVSNDEIKIAVGALVPTEHRLELKRFTKGLMIDDAYNANPVGSLEAVRVLSSFEGMQKAIITPGLIELGEREYECNYALGLESTKSCDIIILVGKNRAKPILDAIATTNFPSEKVFVVSSFREALEVYLPLADDNSVVLIENDLPDNYLN